MSLAGAIGEPLVPGLTFASSKIKGCKLALKYTHFEWTIQPTGAGTFRDANI